MTALAPDGAGETRISASSVAIGVASLVMMVAPVAADFLRGQVIAFSRPSLFIMLAGVALGTWAWLRESKYRPRPVVVCGVAVALALALSVASWRCMNPVTPDSCNYMAGGSAIRHGQPYLNIRDEPQLAFPPGYPTLIALALTVVGDPELGGRLVSVIASLGSVVALYALAGRLMGWHVAGIAAMLLAASPLRIRTSTMVWTESAYLLAVLVALLVIWRWLERGGWNWAALSGLLAGAAYLIRPEAAVLVAIAVVVGYLHRDSRVRRSAQPLAAVLGFAIVAAPYVLFLHAHTGQWELTHKTRHNLEIGEARSVGTPLPRTYRLNADEGTVSSGEADWLSGLPGRALRNAWGMWLRLLLLASPLAFVLAALGLIALIRPRAPGPGVLTMGLTLASPLVFLLPFFWDDRMLLCPAVLVVTLGAAGVSRTAQYVRPAGRDRAAWLVVILACVLMIGHAINVGMFSGPPRLRMHAEMGRWIAEQFPERTLMISRAAVVSYYANKRHGPLPYEEFEEVVAHARHVGASLLLLPTGAHHRSITRYACNATDTDDLEVVRSWRGYVLVRVRSSSSGSGTPRSLP